MGDELPALHREPRSKLGFSDDPAERVLCADRVSRNDCVVSNVVGQNHQQTIHEREVVNCEFWWNDDEQACVFL